MKAHPARALAAFALVFGACGGAENDAAGTVAARRAEPAPPSAVLEEALAEYGESLCREGPLVAVEGRPEFDCDARSTRTTSAGGAALRGAVVDVELDGQIWAALIVEGAGERRIGTLATGWSPGVGGHSAEQSMNIEARDLIPGGAAELFVTYSGEARDSDMGSCDSHAREVRQFVICSVDGGSLACAALQTRASDTREHTLCGDVLDGDGDGDRDEPLPGETETLAHTGFELVERFDGSRITLTRAAWPATVPTPLAGDVAVAELLLRTDLAWPGSVAPLCVVLHGP